MSAGVFKRVLQLIDCQTLKFIRVEKMRAGQDLVAVLAQF
jgi:hypothetical protein